MKKGLIILLALSFLFGVIKSQDLVSNPTKFIEVTGSAELEIEPDEIRLVIGIKEYCKELYAHNSKCKDYATKVPISKIENNLLTDLMEIGIKKEQIIIREVGGNYWRYEGKGFFFSKQFELILIDFNKVDEIIKKINTKGINYMKIGELKNENITEYRKQVKIEALKAAKMKAEYLLKSIDKQLGDIISVVELESSNNYWRTQSMASNTVMGSSDNSGIDNLRKIKLRYEIKVKFEIK